VLKPGYYLADSWLHVLEGRLKVSARTIDIAIICGIYGKECILLKSLWLKQFSVVDYLNGFRRHLETE